MQWGILDWILGQQEAMNGRTDKIQIEIED